MCDPEQDQDDQKEASANAIDTFGQIHFVSFSNTLCSLDQYNLHFRQIPNQGEASAVDTLSSPHFRL